jgi:hypothetical protein
MKVRFLIELASLKKKSKKSIISKSTYEIGRVNGPQDLNHCEPGEAILILQFATP